ncbi:hypothetical protein [Kribbella sp. CA-294648]|uniref:hypothetical protein n=1 Tax=Kribbella sp. CA-294648 TaxID=3239948 RepID=UPI003D93B552
MRITLQRALALSAVLLLSVGCQGTKGNADGELAPVSVTPAELTEENFGPRVLGALRAKGTFSVEAVAIAKEGPDEATIKANVSWTQAGTDVSIPAGDPPMIRIGGVVYTKDDKLTGNPKRPWARLNPRGSDPAEKEAVFVAESVIGLAAGYQVIGGTMFVTEFQRGGQIVIDGADHAQEYIITIDSHLGARAAVLGELLNTRIKEAAPREMQISVAVDAKDLPRRIEYVYDDGADLATRVRLTLRDYGKGLPITAPPAAMVGEVTAGKVTAGST